MTLDATSAPATALLIAAHPDDPEFGAGGTVALWARAGWRDVARVRQAEQRAAARVLGVSEVVFLHYPDGLLEPTLALRRDLTREVRRWRPLRVICQSPLRVLAANALRRHHPDHMAAGAAALAAVYPSASSPHLFPELLREGLEPWIAPEIYVTESGDPDVIVDISETLDTKIAALQAHASQMRPGVEAAVRERARALGALHGLGAAEGFQLIRQD